MKIIAINNGTLIDPKNRIYSKQNLLIGDGKVLKISQEPLDGNISIDAKNLIICPGFVDIHMHEDNYLEEQDCFENIIFEAMLQMGVTTAIGGNCGVGPSDVNKYIKAVDRIGTPVNLGLLLPHETLRHLIGVHDKYSSVTHEQVFEMYQLTKEFLNAGLLGVSFGIRYVPGLDTHELLGITKACNNLSKVIAAHIRDDAKNCIPSLIEFIDIAREIKGFNSKLQISHIGSMAGYGQMREALEYIDSARLNGINIGIDCYPYNAFSTKIGATTFDDGFLERYEIDYDSIELAEGTYRGQRATKEIFQKLRKDFPNTMAIGHVMMDSDIDLALSHPNVALASDGVLNEGQGHPRAAGSFPRFINEYVKKKKLLSLYDVIEKMTILPSQMMNINKGHLSIGADADIIIFNYSKIRDNATFETPLAKPDGIEYVLIGGKIALEKQIVINKHLGKFIRN